MLALSIQQPWAWLIAHGHKRIENRTWRPRLCDCGPVLIHAGKAMSETTQRGWGALADYILNTTAVQIPGFFDAELNRARGGIVGVAELTGYATANETPADLAIRGLGESDMVWFSGPYGLVLLRAKPVPFVPFKGKLGFFEVPDGLVALPEGYAAKR